MELQRLRMQITHDLNIIRQQAEPRYCRQQPNSSIIYLLLAGGVALRCLPKTVDEPVEKPLKTDGRVKTVEYVRTYASP
jgi:hypothetical protein